MNLDASPTAPDGARLANLLGALALSLADAQEAAAREAAGLGASACAALVVVGFYPGTTIGTLARILGLTHSVAVRLAEGLDRDGLLARAPGLADRRAVALRLTPEGEQRRSAILAARAATLRDALGAVEAPAREALGAALEAMLGRLTRSRVEADHICRLCDEAVCPGATCPVECAAVRLEGRP